MKEYKLYKRLAASIDKIIRTYDIDLETETDKRELEFIQKVKLGLKEANHFIKTVATMYEDKK